MLVPAFIYNSEEIFINENFQEYYIYIQILILYKYLFFKEFCQCIILHFFFYNTGKEQGDIFWGAVSKMILSRVKEEAAGRHLI